MKFRQITENDEDQIEETTNSNNNVKRRGRPPKRKERRIGCFGTSLADVFKKEGIEVTPDDKQERVHNQRRRD